MFGRRTRARREEARREARTEATVRPPSHRRDEGTDETFGDVSSGRLTAGPYDAAEAPDDGQYRLDLGSLRLPVPPGAALQLKVDRSGLGWAVHMLTDLGQFTVTAFAAPRSGGLWREVRRELVSRLRDEGAQVGRATGEWGEEIEAVTAHGVLRYLAVDGPRWMLRGVAAGPAEHADARTAVLRDVVREAVVVRGPEPLPVRSPLPLQLTDRSPSNSGRPSPQS